MTGVLVLDRAGEYIEDTEDHCGSVFGLQDDLHAPERMVVLSWRERFHVMQKRGEIAAYMKPLFNIQDIELIDLVDFTPTSPKSSALCYAITPIYRISTRSC